MKNLLLFLVMVLVTHLSAQDRKIQFHGGIGINTQLNTTFGDNANRFVPWGYGVSGNISMKIGEFTVPISLYFSDAGISTFNNFNRLGISPSYKNLKVHLGHRSMQFSPYVLNGNTFFGVGMEYKSDKLRLAAMRGKLKNLTLLTSNQPVLGLDFLNDYNRDVSAIKLGFGGSSNSIELIAFKASDEVQEVLLDNQVYTDYDLRPKDNFALGINSNNTFKNGLYFRSNIMTSFFNENSQSNLIETSAPDFITGIFQPTITSQFGYAGQFDLGFKIKRFNIGINYERISPQFETLGRYYNLNDLDRRKINLSFRVKTFSIQSSFGIEQNDIAETNINTSKRNILSLSMRWKPTKKISVNSTFSNFNVDNTPDVINDNDTLKISRVLTNAMISPRYKFGKEYQSTISFTGLYRNLDNKFAFATEIATTNIYNYKLDYKLNIKSKNLRVGANFSYQVYDFVELDRKNYGLGANASKSLLENRLSVSLSSRYIINTVINKSNGFALSNNARVNYKPFDQHNFSANLAHFLRNRNVGEGLNELRARMSYQFNF